jgi:hypothetical protein
VYQAEGEKLTGERKLTAVWPVSFEPSLLPVYRAIDRLDTCRSHDRGWVAVHVRHEEFPKKHCDIRSRRGTFRYGFLLPVLGETR